MRIKKARNMATGTFTMQHGTDEADRYSFTGLRLRKFTTAVYKDLWTMI